MVVANQVRSQVWVQVRDQVANQVRSQVWVQVEGQIRDRVKDQVRDRVAVNQNRYYKW